MPAVPSSMEVVNFTLTFGGVKALPDVSFSVQADSLAYFIGPTGAGKTSVFNAIAGCSKKG